ncbi:PAS domain S-box protein [Lacinutrix sp. 5H-3-7-4]|uniref:PAS domain S-box protein n=1 Tax=Lacinutrix sp. (strain 5H-3-7-4) TaxID=983544 RepID=UPI00020A34F3|nr:PAS domain S-box protein [Lacinutrix sp. 5H-3-7-4]AEH02652.1 transcriptional regulator, NifA subfamily, Fis Family [Lacinutrix sp. 5H-3-7-4]
MNKKNTKTILLVDDTFENRYLLRAILLEAGYAIIEAKEGKEGLEKLQKCNIDLIISDILMPVMDGYLFCQACKNDETYREIPFIFYTSTYTEKPDEDLALKIGATRFLRKPNDQNKLLSTIEKIFKNNTPKNKATDKEKITEEEVLKFFSERLISKLEQKNIDLKKEVLEKDKAEQLLLHENEVLELLAVNTPLKKVFDRLLLNYESIHPNTYGSLSLLDDDSKLLSTFSSPSLPKGYTKHIKNLKIGKNVGSCGTSAYLKKPVIVSNIPEDKLWEDYKDIAAKFNLKSCWSLPILSKDNKVYGTFAIYTKSVNTPSLEDIKELNFAVNLAKIAIEKTKAIEEVKQKDEYYRNLIDQTNDAIITYKQDGVIYDFNKATYKNLGYTLKEFSKLKIQDIVVDQVFQDPIVNKDLGEGKPVVLIKKFRHKKGHLLDAEISARKQKSGYILGVVRDITERQQHLKEIKKEKEFTSNLLDTMREGLYAIDLDSKIIRVNPSFCKMTGFTKNELLGVKRPYPFSPPELKKENDIRYKLLKQDKNLTDYENIYQRKNGEKFPVHILVSRLDDEQGNKVANFATVQDITLRKKAEKELQESEFRLKQSQKVGNIGSIVVDFETMEFESSKIFDNILGVDKNFVKTVENYNKHIHLEDINEIFGALQQAIKYNKKFDKEYRIIRPVDKKEIWVHSIAESIFDDNGNPVKLIGTLQDITERKQIQIKLEEDEFRLRQSQEVGNIGSITVDLTTNTWQTTDVLDKIFGIPKDYNKTLDNWAKLIHPEDREELVAYLNSCIKNYKQFNKEYRVIRHNDKKVVWLYGIAETVFDEEAKPVKMIGTIQDVTSRKESEIKLKENEKSLIVAQDIAKIGSFNLDLLKKEAETSITFSNIIGVKKGLKIPFSLWQNIVVPEHKAMVKNQMLECIKNAKTFDLEYKILTENNKQEKWVHGLGEIVYNKKEATNFIGTIQDITERKKAENDIKSAKEFNDRLIMAMQEGLLIVDLKGEILMANKSSCDILGYTNEELIGMEMPYPFARIEDFEKISNIIQSLVEGEIPLFQLELIRKNGEQFLASFLAGNIKNDKDEVIALFGTMKDISEEEKNKKILRENAKKSKQKKEVILELAKLVGKDLKTSLNKITKLAAQTLDVGRVNIWSYNKDNVEFYCEKNYDLETNKYTKGDIVDLTVHSAYLEQLKAEKTIIVNDVLTNPITKDSAQEYFIPNKIKSMMDVFINTANGFYGVLSFEQTKTIKEWTADEQEFASSIANIVSLMIESNQRKIAEDELIIEKEFSDELLSSLQEGLSVVNTNGVHIKVNPALCRMTGFTEEELIGIKAPFPYWPPEEYKNIYNILENPLDNIGKTIQLKLMRKEGERFPAVLAISAIKDKNGELIALFSTINDVTKNVERENELKERALKSNIRKNTIIELANSIGEDFNESLKKIAITSAKAMDVAMVTIWEYKDRKTQLLSKVFYNLIEDKFEANKVLVTKRKYPKYFEAFEEKSSLNISDVVNNPITSAFTDEFYNYNKILSRLDVVVYGRNEDYGIISFECTVPNRVFTPDEESFALSIASLVSLMVESKERIIAERGIVQTNQLLVEANKELNQLRDQLEQENVYLRNELDLVFNFEEMVYGSVEFSNVLTEIEKVAPTDATVLLLGESGTGKELLARAIHNIGSRNKKPLIKVNCSAIPRELIESELFGHKKGSFTGAFSDKIGKFELAHEGTLFLDEIGELPLDMQPKILRFLQEGEIEVVGGANVKKLNVRVIAATNRNLEEEVKKKQFREDLYFRLNVFPIAVPPLRERKDDIPLLVEHFVDKFNKAYGKNIKFIADESMSKLKAYNWPGNIRELENLIERASILSTSETLLIPGFESTVQNSKTINEKDFSLDTAQRNHILQVLEKCNWKISGENSASELLKLKPSTLRDRMSKLDIKKSNKK